MDATLLGHFFGEQSIDHSVPSGLHLGRECFGGDDNSKKQPKNVRKAQLTNNNQQHRGVPKVQDKGFAMGGVFLFWGQDYGASVPEVGLPGRAARHGFVVSMQVRIIVDLQGQRVKGGCDLGSENAVSKIFLNFS